MPPKKKQTRGKSVPQKSPSPEPTKRTTRTRGARQKSPSPSPQPKKQDKKGAKQTQKAQKKQTKQKSPSPSPQPKQQAKKGGRRGKQQKSKSKSKSPSPQKKADKKDTSQNLVADTKKDDPVVIEKLVVKGKAAVDKYVPGKDNYIVLQTASKVYACTLNQWGRVGVPGQQSLMGPFDQNKAIQAYEKKHGDKTVKGNYIEIDINYGDDDEQDDGKAEAEETKTDTKQEEVKKAESKLEKETQDLMNLIFDTKLMDETMKEIGYDPKKMPLGKLADSSIQKGYKVLSELQEAIKKKKGRQTYADLSSQFYSYIPHDFGFQKMINFILDDEEKVKSKLNMLQTLSDMKIATTIIGGTQKQNDSESIVDKNYKKLNCDLKVMNEKKNADEWSIIKKCIDNTKEGWKVDIQNIWKVKREGEVERFNTKIGNNRLLWHGSRVTNYGGILSTGLRIAPPEAPASGYLFGKGLYFADQFSKSANYCRGTGNDILIMLCDAAIGNPQVLERPNSGAANLPAGTHSTKGFGTHAPTEESYVDVPNAEYPVKIPQGKPVRTTSSNYQGFNEYIVYNVNQARIRYLLKVSLTRASSGW
ncbi:WGR domain [Pseudocohnilembus persalinus]|uniref:Poly [ADP-ribose] polymerase n=1 Tax=Pseudocohnilembus persalinus TaxID=266149 RepID=A0A0V0QC48_PSEPJ|nr:WGR domain [Pseudocohnilembus persalinus]|eukprot:KRW99806.1 WGR domain [Pseudocohnilembus persalinus]